jgi:hypothetical protein
MTRWIKGIVPDGSGRLIMAERHIWQINIHQKYFKNVVDSLTELFIDLFCDVCSKNHHTKSGLITCLRLHRQDTVNYYLDNIVESSS